VAFAAIVTVVSEPTGRVPMSKVPEFWALLIGTAKGEVFKATFVLLLVKLTVKLLGAGPLRSTCPVMEVPPVTWVGLKLSLMTVGGFTCRVADLLLCPRVAVTMTFVILATGLLRT
jgi:hypothetical protein